MKEAFCDCILKVTLRACPGAAQAKAFVPWGFCTVNLVKIGSRVNKFVDAILFLRVGA